MSGNLVWCCCLWLGVLSSGTGCFRGDGGIVTVAPVIER